MKYIRTYETEEKFLTDKDSTSRGFRLKPTLYKYSEAGDHRHLELDDPTKRGDSTYMEITLDSDAEFSFYIGNAPGDTQTIRDCKVDWGDGDSGSTRLTADDKGFKLSHNYKAGSYSIELYAIEGYSIIGDTTNYRSLISPVESVKRVVLGNSVVSIGDETFDGCTSLTSVYISEGVTTIGDSAFYGCTSLTSIYIPNSVTSIGSGVFGECTSLTSVNIPEGITSIGDGAFKNCTSLKSIHIPEGVTTIGDTTYEGVFEECSSLTSVYIPRSVTSIGRNAFKGCTSLTSIDIPEGVTTIDDGTFNNCTSLSSISIHSTTRPTINGDAFNYLPANGILHIKRGVIDYMWIAMLDSFDNWRIVEDL